jgi:hypothetical protein
MHGEITYVEQGSANLAISRWSGFRDSNALINAVRFLFDTGNVSAGTFKLFGVN